MSIVITTAVLSLALQSKCHHVKIKECNDSLDMYTSSILLYQFLQHESQVYLKTQEKDFQQVDRQMISKKMNCKFYCI